MKRPERVTPADISGCIFPRGRVGFPRRARNPLPAVKPLRRFLFAGLLPGLAVALAATLVPQAIAAEKTRTYAIVGYHRGPAPTPLVLGKAISEIAAKMPDCRLVPNPDKADTVVNVIFRGNSYELIFNALSPEALKQRMADMEFSFRQKQMLDDAKWAETGSHGRGK
jgi:hypothetical protein